MLCVEVLLSQRHTYTIALQQYNSLTVIPNTSMSLIIDKVPYVLATCEIKLPNNLNIMFKEVVEPLNRGMALLLHIADIYI